MSAVSFALILAGVLLVQLVPMMRKNRAAG